MRVEDSRQLRLGKYQVPGKRQARRQRVDAQFARSLILQQVAERFDYQHGVAIFEPAHRAGNLRILVARRGDDESFNPGALAINHQPL